MTRTMRLLLAAGCALAIAGCASSVKLDEAGTAPIEDKSATAGAGAGAAAAAGAGSGATVGAAGAGSADGRQIAPVTTGSQDPLSDPSSPLAKRSIYFEFDSFTVADTYRATIEAHARYLASNAQRRVVIQGNADDRGSREYNLALGQKRSEAVRKALGALGVAENQVEAVSFGEEKPRATGTDEASWAENRRADLVYQ
ncbi:MAG: peptidoglycan-associated lipoprotein Pal [Burkholderiaceae bacterium]|nr:peptidoglycan-associated lipoprotein Pal [Burkholderiaceae bacterium]